MPTLCRDCGASPPAGARCAACGSPRLLRHAELDRLAIAHLDCDAFYATVEKRDNPALADRPVIVGGGRRGVVSACCYIARVHGVRSAMPMFKALKLCPQAMVIRPRMATYAAVGAEVRRLMREVTPLVEPLSIDEAFLDLTGTERLHQGSPARTLAALARRIEAEIGITVSIGLSHNKFLAKLASELDKPRGFAVIGRAETLDFLGPRPISTIFGVGRATALRLAADGLHTIADIRARDEEALLRRHGSIGRRLWHLAHGRDDRPVDPDQDAKSVSAETTFNDDLADLGELSRLLWIQTEEVAARLRRKGLSARGVTLKLKTADFRIITRNRQLDSPTQLADRLYRAALPLLEKECDGRSFRLIGLGTHDLGTAAEADPPDLVNASVSRSRRIEDAIASLRDRLGPAAITRGRSLPRNR
ncbi:MAG: DNA polymerase IV [Thalassobaculales bacterium]